jgi:hypothetical protein
VRILTSSYEFAHGRKPRGYGYWIFQVVAQVDGKWVKHEIGDYGNYAAARKLAVKKFKDAHQGKVTIHSVEVLP